MLAPFVLRRLKADVLQQLVAKTDRLEKVPLSKARLVQSRQTAFVDDGPRAPAGSPLKCVCVCCVLHERAGDPYPSPLCERVS